MPAADAVTVQGVERLAIPLQPVAALLRVDLCLEVLPAVRTSLDERRAATAAAVPLDDVTTEEVDVRGPDGRVVRCRLYRPTGAGVVPVLLYLHAGAFVLGNLDTDHASCVALARDAGVAILSVDYRLAPEHPFPAALEDALLVLGGVCERAVEWGLDVSRLAVAGSSAGAGLAAVLALHARDALGPRIRQVLLHQPVLDDRCDTGSMREFTATAGFDRTAALQMWQHYTGGRPLAGALLAAGRAEELRGLPDTLITCSEVDPLRDEALDYARRLLVAGVSTELHVYPRTCHGFDSVLPDWSTSRAHRALFATAARRLHDLV